MKRLPLLNKTDVVGSDICLTSLSDKMGHILDCVEYLDNDTESGMIYFFFTHLSSALDFIQTNFIL